MADDAEEIAINMQARESARCHDEVVRRRPHLSEYLSLEAELRRCAAALLSSCDMREVMHAVDFFEKKARRVAIMGLEYREVYSVVAANHASPVRLVSDYVNTDCRRSMPLLKLEWKV